MADRIIKYKKDCRYGQITKLFGNSGVGNFFEFETHTMLSEHEARDFWCLTKNKKLESLNICCKKKVLIRSIDDIQYLKDGE
jgi:hypothetical protein